MFFFVCFLFFERQTSKLIGETQNDKMHNAVEWTNTCSGDYNYRTDEKKRIMYMDNDVERTHTHTHTEGALTDFVEVNITEAALS